MNAEPFAEPFNSGKRRFGRPVVFARRQFRNDYPPIITKLREGVEWRGEVTAVAPPNTI